MKKPLIILAGPTAVGKSELSIALAKKINGAVISADSIQVYKYMDIGSAKITKEEMIGAEDLGDYYKVPADNRNLNYAKYENLGDKDLDKVDEYNSHNTQRLDVDGMKELLLRLDLFKGENQ